MSRAERRALATLLVLGIGGHLLRLPDAPDDPSGGALAALIDPGRGDPLAHHDSSRALARPLDPGERIDADRAGPRELERLPGVGPALARRIVADRESLGAFGGIAGLDRVVGIGSATLGRLAPHLTFSGVRAEPLTSVEDTRLDLNAAGIADFERLDGIGVSRAMAIVAFRDSAGPFRHVEELRQVPGIPASLVARLASHFRPP